MNFQSMDGETLLKSLQIYCVEKGASDLHISPQKQDVRIEWRIHGILQLLTTITPKTFEDLSRRIKFESKLKLNLTNIPQDGQFTFSFVTKDAAGAEETRTINVRVATLPSRFGEAYTLRFLDPARGIRPLAELGFPMEIEKQLRDLIELPNGLILVTGPTGSGKTTTLYALLSTVIGKERNIITLEDPVEYELTGIIQSEIDNEHDYTFANGLRSILRHDPDVILVGEIRDLETAQTAVNASLTGHLVLATLHTNSAIEAIPRFLSMGVSPYTFAPALRAVLAQRLIRTLKDECQAEGATYDPTSHNSYGGQMTLPELLTISPTLQSMMLAMEPDKALLEQAKKEGFKSMREWGEEFVQKRVTSMQEVLRVTT